MQLETLKIKNEAPEWLTDEGFITLSNGYLLKDETPRQMYRRVAKAASGKLFNPKLEEEFFQIIWKNWLCLATPVASNMGTNRGLPISCNSIHVGDSIDSIFKKQHELAILSKNGAGVGVYIGDIRARNSDIQGNGKSEGIIPWAKCFDSTTLAVNQGSTRRGASALYLPIEHGDRDEFLEIRKPTGDVNRRCSNIHQAFVIDDIFMNKVESGDKEARKVWQEVLKTRFESGEPFILFIDNVNKQNPKEYIDQNLLVKTSNICTEIMLHTDTKHTFVCCLSSLNLARYDEWKNSNLVSLAVKFLDAVLSEYIEKARKIEGLENSVRFAEKSRAIGIGVLGWHSLLQQKKIPFDSFQAMQLNNEIFKYIKEKADEESFQLGLEFGKPEWCVTTGKRNTHLIAVAPTVSNSLISGGVSPGIEPIAANCYALKSAKGTFIIKNKILEAILIEKERNTPEVWKSINENDGSISHLDFLSKEEKEVFLTAREISQFAIIKQAAQRQKYIDQGQSINLFFGKNSSPKYINQVHLEAWRLGIKSLYYCRAESVLKGDLVNRQKEECKACEG